MGKQNPQVIFENIDWQRKGWFLCGRGVLVELSQEQQKQKVK